MSEPEPNQVADSPPLQPIPLDRIPLPPAVLGLAILTGIVFVVALIRAPGSFADGINYERAHRFIAKDDPKRAVPLLKPLTLKYPDAVDVKIDLAAAYAGSGDPDDAASILNTFAGKEFDSDQLSKLNRIDADMRRQGFEVTSETPAGAQ